MVSIGPEPIYGPRRCGPCRNPSYFYALEILARRGVKVIPVQWTTRVSISRIWKRKRPDMGRNCCTAFRPFTIPRGPSCRPPAGKGSSTSLSATTCCWWPMIVYQLLNQRRSRIHCARGVLCVIFLGFFFKNPRPWLAVGVDRSRVPASRPTVGLWCFA